MLFAADIRHFKSLSRSAQRVLVSFAVFEFVYPLLFLFVNAFILRRHTTFLSVVLYNLGSFIVLPISFYLNGWLLKRVRIELLYLLGMVGQGVVACCVFFLPVNTLLALFCFGAMQGVPMGLYWANRNFVSIEVTNDTQRSYFTGLEQLFAVLAGIVTPVIIGWAIAMGDRTHLISGEDVYKFLGVLSLVILFVGARVLASAQLSQPKYKKLWIGASTPIWTAARWTEVFRGIQNSLDLFIAPLIVFTFLGKEASLGTLQSVTAMIGVGVIYLLARFLTPTTRLRVLAMAVGGLIALAGVFLLNYSLYSAAAYVLLAVLFSHVTWISSNPITMRAIDLEDGGDPTNNFAYVCDRELFLNVGRVIGVVCFIIVVTRVTPAAALRFMPFLAACSQVGAYVFCRRMMKTLYGTI